MQIACPKHPNENGKNKITMVASKEIPFQSYVKHLL
jgi:hypothetical protein